jgi:hypothetical protein
MSEKILRRKKEVEPAQLAPPARKPVAVAPVEPVASKPDRAQVMKEYVDRQQRRGNRQVKVWVPEHMVPWVLRMADDARDLHRGGKDPLALLPKSLIDED